MKIMLAFSFLLGLTFISCKDPSFNHNGANQEANSEITTKMFIDSSIVYQTENLKINRLSKHIYVHISYLNTDDFGKVACNGMLVINENKGIVFDTPTDDKSSLELINFVTNELKSESLETLLNSGLDEYQIHERFENLTSEENELIKVKKKMKN